MGLFSRDVHTLDDLFVHTLRDIYYAENRIVKALPDMIEKAFEPQLKQAFNSHLGETENHISRLQEVFRMYDVEVKGVDCPAIDGILEEVDDLVGEDDQPVLDAALIAAAQVVEHYQIARYGFLILIIVLQVPLVQQVLSVLTRTSWVAIGRWFGIDLA